MRMKANDTRAGLRHLEDGVPHPTTRYGIAAPGGGMSLILSIFLAACGSEEPSSSGPSDATQGDATVSSTTTGTTGSATTSAEASSVSTVTSVSSASSTNSLSSTGALGSTATSGSASTASLSNASSTTLAGSSTDGAAASSTTADAGTTGSNDDCTDTGAHEDFSFFVTSYQHILELSGSEVGFGGDLRYNGAATGLEGADAICQEMARRVCFGQRTWRAYLSTSTVNAIDRIGTGPWYDYSGAPVSDDVAGLLSGERPAGGATDSGTYDELGLFHDGNTDVDGDGRGDDDHDTMTATLADGTYSGFSCDDWTSTTATDESAAGTGEQQGPGGMGGMGGPGLSGGIMMGHSWPAMSGQHWAEAHGGHQCAPGVNLVQNGGGDSSTVGGGGGYGGFYCFALAQ